MNQDVKKFYDKNALAYKEHGSLLLVEILDTFIGDAPQGSLFLDIGSGVGQDTNYFSEKGFFSVGLDISGEMLRLARNNPHPFIPILGDMRLPLPFPDGVFDRIWASSSLYTHLEGGELTEALKEVSRVIKNDGVFGGIVKEDDGTKFSFFSLTKDALSESLSHFFPNRNIEHFATPDEKKWLFFMGKKE